MLIGFLFDCSERKSPEAATNYLRYFIAATPASLDPATANDQSYYQIAFNMLETLIAVNWQTGALEPMLATSWQPDALHRRWTFVLRRDVFFHDGSRLNAAAVKVSLERQFLPDSPYYHPKLTDQYRTAAFDMVQEILTPNDSTVQFLLKYPYAAFLDNLASPYYATVVSPQALATYGKDFGRHPIGTGPFAFMRWDSTDQKIVIKKNTHYWRETAQLDSVVFQVVPILEARINALQQDQAEVISNLSAAGVSSFNEDTCITLIAEPSLATVILGMKNQKPPFNNLKTRKALAHAINREYIVNTLGRGLSTLAQGVFSPRLAYFDSILTALPYDTVQTKILLQNSDKQQPILQIGYYSDTDSLRGSPLIQEIFYELMQAGIPTKIRAYTNWEKYEAEVLEGDSENLFLLSRLSFTRHPDNFLYSLFHSQSSQNFLNYRSPVVDALLLQARHTNNVDTQQRLYRRVQEIVLQEVPAIFINHPKIVYAIRSRVKNFHTTPLGIPQLTAVKLAQPPRAVKPKFLW